MDVFFKLLLLLLLVLLNGYFVASEFALVGVRKTRIEELARRGNRAAKLVKNALSDLDSYISATQLGITIASIALGWVGEPVLAKLIEPAFGFMPDGLAFFTAHGVSVFIAFTIITFLHIVLGELAPKTLALRRSESVSLIIVAPLIAFATIFRPFILVLNYAGNLLLKPFGFSQASDKQLFHSEEEIKMILSQSGEGGTIPKRDVEMVYRVFRFGDTPVKQISIPRVQVIAFEAQTSLKKIVSQTKRLTHSRYPVYKETIDNIIGFVHIKDLFKATTKSTLDKKLSKSRFIRQIIKVEEDTRIDDVLLQMRKRRIHMAVVLDQYGGTEGIVTLEDVMESLVGEIEDEFERKPAKKKI